MFKLFRLRARRLIKVAFSGIGYKLSIIFLLFSVAVSLMIIAPNCFDRIPIYSYFIRELELPITYQLSGMIEIVDADGNIVSTDAEVFIGGYSTHTTSNGEYILNFSSPKTNEVFVVIRYTNPNGKIETRTEYVPIMDSVHDIERMFVYNV